MGGTPLPSNLGAYGYVMNISYKYFLVFVSMTDLLFFIYLGFFSQKWDGQAQRVERPNGESLLIEVKLYLKSFPNHLFSGGL